MKLSESSGGSIVLLHSTIIPPGSTKVPPGSTTVLPGSTIEYYSTSSAIVPLSSAIVPPFLPKSWIFGDVKISKIKKYKMQSGSERIFQKFLL